MNRFVSHVLLLLALGVSASAQTRTKLYQFNGDGQGTDPCDQGCSFCPQLDTHYALDDGLKTITILSGATGGCSRFQFESRLEQWNGSTWVDIGPGDINLITVNANAGAAVIEVKGDPAKSHFWGARDIRSINMNAANVNDHLWGILSSGNLGADGMFPTDLAGPIQIGGDLLGGLFGGPYSTVHVIGDVRDVAINVTSLGNLKVEGLLLSDVTAANLGAVEVQGFGTSTGNLTNGSHQMANIWFLDSYSGAISIDGDMSQKLWIGYGTAVDDVPGDFTGSITLTGGFSDDTGNSVWIRHMDGGSIECQDLNMRAQNGGQWLVVGQGDVNSNPPFHPVNSFDPTLVHSGPITVHGRIWGRIYCRGLNDLNITAGSIEANVDASLGYGGIMTAMGFMPNATITVLGDFLKGAIKYPSAVHPDSLPMNVPITITGDMGSATTTARISSAATINGNPANFDIGGVIHIGGDLYGAAAGDGPAIFSDGGLSGQILIDGSLIDGDVNEIEIEQAMTSAAAIAIDYDGWQTGDDWQAGAVIRVGSTNYTETHAAVNDLGTPPNLWHVTQCVGDCNNDGQISSFDIEPFLDILFDQPKYAMDYPGLGGSMIYHADGNCDGSVDAFDIEPFLDALDCTCCINCALRYSGAGRMVATTIVKTALLRLAAGAIPAVGQCDARADQFIDLLTTHAAPRHYSNLLNTCAFLAAHYREVNDPQQSRMWRSVYDGLSANFAG